MTGLGGSTEDLLASLFGGNGNIDGFAQLFGITEVEGANDLVSFQLTRGEEWFWVINDGVLADGWDFDATGLLTWDGAEIAWAAIPEPATLAIVGLGLIGLGYARRRRK